MSTPYTHKVSSKYGSPMGRYTDVDALALAPCYLRRVHLDHGGYDAGGAYWGTRTRGESLWCAWNDEGGVYFVDAVSRAGAMAKCEKSTGMAVKWKRPSKAV